MEKLLLIATVEELLRYEIVLREHSDTGAILVFPSQFTRDWPEAPTPKGKAVTFCFDGPVLNIYAALVVRLSRSGLYSGKEMWKNAAVFKTKVGGECGIWMQEIEEGRAILTLFFDSAASEETRFQFEEYIKIHLERRALKDTIIRRRVFVCPECDTGISDEAVSKRRQRGFDWIACNVCETRISILDTEERLKKEPISVVIDAIDRNSEIGRNIDTTATIIQGKVATGDFDVFLCHKSKDKPAVKEIGEQLKEQGILPWLDEWELRPGLPWQKMLEKQIKQIKSAAVFVGQKSLGPWQDAELAAFLRQFIKRECPVIPVILPECTNTPELPIFLEGMTWVDFRKESPDPIQQLIWGITGKK